MNIRLALGKKEMDESLAEFAKVLDAYAIMLSDKSDLHGGAQDSQIKTLKKELNFPYLEAKEQASVDQAWAEWKKTNLNGQKDNWPLFKIYIRDCMRSLALFKNALNRCGDTKVYEQLLQFLNRDDVKNKKDEVVIMEEHFLTDPADVLYKQIYNIQQFTAGLTPANSTDFKTKETAIYAFVIKELELLKNQIERFNTQDGKVDVEKFLEWRNPAEPEAKLKM